MVTQLEPGVDGVHLTEESHKLLEEKIYNVVKTIF